MTLLLLVDNSPKAQTKAQINESNQEQTILI